MSLDYDVSGRDASVGFYSTVPYATRARHVEAKHQREP